MRTFSGPEWVILAITSLGHAICHMAELVFPAVMVAVMREQGLEPAQATLLAVLGYVLMGLGAVPVGLWADASDPWRIHFYYFLMVAASCVAVALAFNPLTLFLSLTGLGLATSIYHPTGLAILSLGIRRKSLAMGINGVAGSIGIALAPLVGELAARHAFWQLAYFVVAGLAIFSALLMLAMWSKRFQPARPPEDTTMVENGDDSLRAAFFGFPALLLCVMMLGGLNYRCLATALPAYLGNITLIEGISNTFLVLLVGGAVGQIVGGRLGDRFGPRRIYLGFVCLLAPASLLLGALGESPARVAAAGLASIFLFGQQPVENALLAHYSSIRRRSLSYGTKFIMTFGVGALGTQVVGIVWERTGGLADVFWLIACSAALMLGVLMYWCARNPAPQLQAALGEPGALATGGNKLLAGVESPSGR